MVPAKPHHPPGLRALLLPALLLPGLAQAAPPAINTGDTAWMIVATLLVLMMTLPGLALFYGGL
ncbi:MAG: ammonia channel protein, partial [Arenimonas sp.]|nr:ammonia channel protein [Arenimonas sp.]